MVAAIFAGALRDDNAGVDSSAACSRRRSTAYIPAGVHPCRRAFAGMTAEVTTGALSFRRRPESSDLFNPCPLAEGGENDNRGRLSRLQMPSSCLKPESFWHPGAAFLDSSFRWDGGAAIDGSRRPFFIIIPACRRQVEMIAEVTTSASSFRRRPVCDEQYQSVGPRPPAWMHACRDVGGRAASGTAAEGVEPRRERRPTPAWMQGVEPRLERRPKKVRRLRVCASRCEARLPSPCSPEHPGQTD